MTGYREHGYDPNAYEQPGPVVRPYNWAQWTGVGLAAIGFVMLLLHVAGRIGWIPQWIEKPVPSAFMLMLIGVSIINSRRHPGTDPAPELAAERKRWLFIILGICAAMIGAAVAIEFSGA
jgi:hypothetical protein